MTAALSLQVKALFRIKLHLIFTDATHFGGSLPSASGYSYNNTQFLHPWPSLPSGQGAGHEKLQERRVAFQRDSFSWI